MAQIDHFDRNTGLGQLHGQGSQDEGRADLFRTECLCDRRPICELLATEERSRITVLGHPTGDRTGEVSCHRKEPDNELLSIPAKKLARLRGEPLPPHVVVNVGYGDEQRPQARAENHLEFQRSGFSKRSSAYGRSRSPGR